MGQAKGVIRPHCPVGEVALRTIMQRDREAISRLFVNKSKTSKWFEDYIWFVRKIPKQSSSTYSSLHLLKLAGFFAQIGDSLIWSCIEIVF
jgi:hypothetical protein